jgi:hypothetical protein
LPGGDDRCGDVVDVYRLLQPFAVARHRDDRPATQTADQPGHVAVPGGAVDHRRAGDGAVQSAFSDGRLRGEAHCFALRVEAGEDRGGVDEHRASHTGALGHCHVRRRVAETDGRGVQQKVDAVHRAQQDSVSAMSP